MKRMLLGVILTVGLAVQAAAAEDRSVESLLELAASGRSAALASAVDDLMADKTMPAREREAILYHFAIGVRSLPPGDIPLEVLDALTRYESQVLEAHPESRGALKAPLYPVARIAEGSIRFARYERQVADMHRTLATSPSDFFDALRREKAATDADLLADVMQRSAPATLAAVREPLIEAWRERPSLAPAAASLAIRLGDFEVAARLIDKADASAARRVLESVHEAFDTDSAMGLIRAAARRPALASAAVMEAARLVDAADGVRRWLYEQLDDERLGASAATALARGGGSEAVVYATDSFRAGMPEPGMRHRLLLLHLADSDEARAFLRAFANDRSMPEALRREVRQWQ